VSDILERLTELPARTRALISILGAVVLTVLILALFSALNL